MSDTTYNVTTNRAANESGSVPAGSGGGGSFVWGSFVPTVTLVGGAGNTVPIYTNNIGRKITVGKIVFYDIFLSVDGGAEGAGTGVINIALDNTIGTNQADSPQMCGGIITKTGGVNYQPMIELVPASTTVIVYSWDERYGIISLKGGDQADINRRIRLTFQIEIN